MTKLISIEINSSDPELNNRLANIIKFRLTKYGFPIESPIFNETQYMTDLALAKEKVEIKIISKNEAPN